MGAELRALLPLLGLLALADGLASSTESATGAAMTLEAEDDADSPSSAPPFAVDRAVSPAPTANRRRRRRTARLPDRDCGEMEFILGLPCPPASVARRAAVGGRSESVGELGAEGVMPWDVMGAAVRGLQVKEAEARTARGLAVFDAPPAEGPLLDLRLPGWTLTKLLSHWKGGPGGRDSLTPLLHQLQLALSSAAGVHKSQVRVLDIHGSFKRVEESGRVLRSGGSGPARRLGEEVLVRFCLEANESARAEQALHAALAEPRGALFQGRLRELLLNASVTRSSSSSSRFLSPQVEEDGVQRICVVLLPMGIAAILTGILFWLAAW
uniref:Uncharacterized protein n=1 Tax=Alexandrium monilatum TaxID=311494 RepID=A0A7S4QMB8_9DINO